MSELLSGLGGKFYAGRTVAFDERLRVVVGYYPSIFQGS